MVHASICGRTVGSRHGPSGIDGLEIRAGRTWRAPALCGLVACAGLILVAVGCTNEQSRVVRVDADTFQSAVLDCTQPVLVDFYKDGCPICMPLDPTLDRLSSEYAGRVKVCRFVIMTAYWTFPSVEIKNKHHIALVPTVVLFDKGKEVWRWAVVYTAEPYRKELDKVAPTLQVVEAPPGK